jgi:hypothetical protein
VCSVGLRRAFFLFNHLHFWLPWPSVKLAYIGAGGAVFRRGAAPARAAHRHPAASQFLVCLAAGGA